MKPRALLALVLDLATAMLPATLFLAVVNYTAWHYWWI